jgi:hypothetical protein
MSQHRVHPRQTRPRQTRPRQTRPRALDPEAGGALAFVLIVMTALLFIGALSLELGISGRRSSVQNMFGKKAFFCAETGLDRARGLLSGMDISTWNAILAQNPPLITSGDCTGPEGFSFQATLRDNVDEFPNPPGGTTPVNDPFHDSDGTVIVDVQTLQGGLPVATVSGLMSRGGSAFFSDYGHQDRLGATKPGNK